MGAVVLIACKGTVSPKNDISFIYIVPNLDDLLLWNTKEYVLQNVHAAQFHSINVKGDMFFFLHISNFI